MKIVFGALLLLVTCCSSAASLEKAKMLSEHGLKDESRIEYIDLVFEGSTTSIRAEALYSLGLISFEEGKINTALSTWENLVAKYPSSKQAQSVQEKISQLSGIAGDSARDSVSNAVAQSYLTNADFWSGDKSNKFTIDSSWIPKVEAAIKWYDKTIAEFPNTSASKVAYLEKMKTLLGWKDRGQYGSTHGVQGDFEKYMPQLLATFKEYNTSYPDSSTVQALRYQIAQAYWSQKDWVNTKKWLNEIITTSGDNENFYSDAAQLRLKKVEY